MSAFTNGLGNSPEFLVKGYPLSSVGEKGTGTVVDVGGSAGSTSVALARAAPGLKFVVQDRPEMIRGAKETIPADVTGRIEFMVHDFFTVQRVSADVYLFRYIFHDRSDQHAIKILRATVPALRPGSRIVVNDSLVPEPKTLSPPKERTVRYGHCPAAPLPFCPSHPTLYKFRGVADTVTHSDMDMTMLSLYNSWEREKKVWERLFQEADARSKDIRIWVPDGATLAIIEAVWAG